MSRDMLQYSRTCIGLSSARGLWPLASDKPIQTRILLAYCLWAGIHIDQRQGQTWPEVQV